MEVDSAIVQAMVFGNYDFQSGAGKLTLRNADGTASDFSGTWLPQLGCQGVAKKVAAIRKGFIQEPV